MTETSRANTASQQLIGMTRSTALEFAGRGIRINALAPGLVDTPLLESAAPGGAADMLNFLKPPINRLSGPEEQAKLIAFLLSDDAGYCTGGVYTSDGGMSAR
jgi:NAD(P)-dependent dehydrogenase (short-subunit alcohol dehydrogenase family)